MKIFVKVPLIIILTAIAMFAQSKTPSLPKTVSKVDLNRYAGEWFEIARYPNKFQKKCKGNTTATYQIRPD
ncbi:lipocalin family protein, partial [Escherichia coli]|nr:lipocalin family protein [Escherichia coli]